MLVDSSNQLVSYTEFSRNGANLFDRISRGEHLVILRKSQAVAVLVNIEEYENIVSELERLKEQERK